MCPLGPDLSHETGDGSPQFLKQVCGMVKKRLGKANSLAKFPGLVLPVEVIFAVVMISWGLSVEWFLDWKSKAVLAEDESLGFGSKVFGKKTNEGEKLGVILYPVLT